MELEMEIKALNKVKANSFKQQIKAKKLTSDIIDDTHYYKSDSL